MTEIPTQPKTVKHDLPSPTPDLVREGVRQFAEQGRVTEAALRKLLLAFPNNTETDEVLLKVIALNQIYSTNIFAVQVVAEMIQAASIDAALQAGDPGVVHRIDRLKFTSAAGKAVDKSIYSFATKYCALHQPRHYPIYDGLIATKLMEYSRRDQFARFTYDDLRHYPTFKQIVLDFQAHYGLKEFTLRETDQFLWSLGKGLLNSS